VLSMSYFRIEFKGKIAHNEMPHLLGGADVFVSTSRSDGNNVSLNEAMACGAFPIATDIAANRAWVTHNKNGILFPCLDANKLAGAINIALEQPDWRADSMAENWKIIKTKASWQTAMERMESHYHRLVSQMKGPIN